MVFLEYVFLRKAIKTDADRILNIENVNSMKILNVILTRECRNSNHILKKQIVNSYITIYNYSIIY